jgi:hypothetical protein
MAITRSPRGGDALRRLRELLEESELSIVEFARLVLGRDERTVRRWLSQEIAIPEQAATWMDRITLHVTGPRVRIDVTRAE